MAGEEYGFFGAKDWRGKMSPGSSGSKPEIGLLGEKGWSITGQRTGSSGGGSSQRSHGGGIRGVTAPIDGGAEGVAGLVGGITEGAKDAAKAAGRAARSHYETRRASHAEPEAPPVRGWSEPGPSETWGGIQKQSARTRIGERVVGWVERRHQERQAQAAPGPQESGDLGGGFRQQEGSGLIVGSLGAAAAREAQKNK